MSLDSYVNLKSEIQVWMTRSDLSGDVDTMIDLFEAWANRNFRVRQMEDEATADATEYMSFPTDFLELRDIQWQGSPRRQLDYVTPVYADLYDTSGAAGTPRFYTLVGNEIRIIPAPDSATPIRIAYWRQIPALSATSTSNWLLEQYPDAYLYGALLQGNIRTKDPETAGYIKQSFAEVVQEIERAGRRSNVGNSLQIRPA